MQALGKIATALVTRETVLPALSVARPPSLTPTSLDEAKAISAWAEATMPVPTPASPGVVAKRLEHLDAMFPRQVQNERSGEIRTAGYLALLIGWSDEALAFMVREACKRYNWFPTAKQCLDILEEYCAPEAGQTVALIECRRYVQEAFDQWIQNVREGQPLGDVPDQWLRIAVERGLARRLQDGSYVSRARFIGPTMRARIFDSNGRLP